MKINRIASVLFAIAAAFTASAKVPVYLDPDIESPEIGVLDTSSLAVPAEWPTGSDPISGWNPVYLRGVFDVYVDNNDIGKELEAKPGRPYFLKPDKASPALAIATDKDKADIISVDSWFCKMRLETIVVGYIQDNSVDASAIVTSLQDIPSEAPKMTAAEAAITDMVGRFAKTGMMARTRTGYDYKLIGTGGKTIAFVDVSKIPERVSVADFLGIEVRVSGFISQSEEFDTVILKAQTLKRGE